MLASLAYAITHRCQKFKLAGSFFQTVNELYISCAYSRAKQTAVMKQSKAVWTPVLAALNSSPDGFGLRFGNYYIATKLPFEKDFRQNICGLSDNRYFCSV